MSNRIFRSTGCVLSSRSYVGSVEPPATVLEDESRYGNNGALLGAGEPDWVQLPSGLWVLSFDGDNDKIDLGNPASLELGTKDFTIILWMKTSTDTVKMLSKYVDTNDRWYAGISGEKATLYGRTTAVSPIFYLKGDTTSIVDDVWHQTAFVCDRGNRGWVYVDASEETDVGFTTCTADDITNTADLLMGLYATVYYPGYIALLRIYRNLLSAEQIAAIYQAERHWFGV